MPTFDHRLVRALDHPTRARFLRLLAEREAMIVPEALPLLGGEDIALRNLAYHVRVLHNLELVELASEVDGGAEAPFRLTQAGTAALVALGIEPR